MKLKSLFTLPSLNRKIGIDLGTSRVRIWTDQNGFIVDEPSVIAIDPAIGKVLAVGKEAEDMIGRVSSHIQVSHPIQGGAVVQADLVQAMLRVFIQKLFASPYFFRPSMMVSIPSNLSGLQKEIVVDVLYSLGAREVLLVDQLLAAAIGAGVPIADASGSFVLQLGGGVSEGGITSLGSLVISRTSEYAGAYIDKAIERVVRQEAQIQIGKQAAERLKKQLVTFLSDRPRQLTLTGQDIVESVPKEVVLSSQVFAPIMKELLQRYVALARQLFEQIPPELTNDVIDKGMIMSGGLAQIEGLDVALLQALGVPVSVVEEPDRSVIKGVAQILQNLDLFKESIGYKE